ncbi:MAG: hypothetical protein OHK0024_11160 [Thalassobaculales bacterium]
MSYDEFLVATKVAGLVIFITIFLGVIGWIFRPGSGRLYQAAARIPLEDRD